MNKDEEDQVEITLSDCGDTEPEISKDDIDIIVKIKIKNDQSSNDGD